MQKGDIHAFDTIYRRFAIMMLDTAYRRLPDKYLAEDIVQNVFARLWDKRAQLDVENLGAYLRSAVHYEVLNHVTRSKKLFDLNEALELIAVTAETADQNALYQDTLKLVLSFAETLPPKRKEVFLGYIQSQYTTREIAKEMNISQKTVQKHLKAAMADFKTQVMPAIIALMAMKL